MRSMDSRSLQKYIMYFIQKPKDKGKWEKEKDSQFHLKYLNCRIVLNRPKKTKNKKTPQKSHTQVPLLFLTSYISMVHFLQLMNQFWSNMTT